VAVVTGGSRGIGRAAALALAGAGASLALSYLSDKTAAEETALRCATLGPRAVAIRADATSAEDTDRLFEAAAALGPVETVVANAGVWEGVPLAEMTDAQWRRVMEQNLDSLFLTCRAAARALRPLGRGSIVVLSSTAGQRGEAGHAAYAASKGAAISLVKSLAQELGPHGVRVNAVAPGWVETDMARAAIDADRPAIVAAIPLARVALAADIAGPILFLASPRLARHVTGEVLNVNGGSVLVG
jgi:3-oxoacyl-[acyl-carrier protein] reductase